MVLQRNVAVPVWGWAEAGEKVTVTIAGRSCSATAGNDMRWRAELPAMKAGGPHALRVEGGNVITGPVSVRYGWANNPSVNLYNSASLPATPFRTDSWQSAQAVTCEQLFEPLAPFNRARSQFRRGWFLRCHGPGVCGVSRWKL